LGSGDKASRRGGKKAYMCRREIRPERDPAFFEAIRFSVLTFSPLMRNVSWAGGRLRKDVQFPLIVSPIRTVEEMLLILGLSGSGGTF
jgi:hypothetical protein